VTKGTEALTAEQRVHWEAAQALWGVRMHEAKLAPNARERSFAWFGFPPSVTVDPVLAASVGADRHWSSVFAHELGHHVLSPSTRVTDLKIRQQMARALTASSVHHRPDTPDQAAYLSNLWSDMLINTRVVELQRGANPTAEPDMVALWKQLEGVPTANPDWWVVMRAYERLWGLFDGTLCGVLPPTLPAEQGEYTSVFATNPAIDAAVLADTVRTFADDPIRGALRFGMVMAPYLLRQPPEESGGGSSGGGSAACAGATGGGDPTAAELDEVMRDGRLREVPAHPIHGGEVSVPEAGAPGVSGQSYGLAHTLALYSGVDEATVLQAWYSAAARQWVRPYVQPSKTTVTGDEMPAALELWALEDELDDIDWPASLSVSPRVIPGVTTRQRTRFTDDRPSLTESVHLDLYIDSSGSMPSPTQESPAILAGTILILSVLGGGGRVRVTSFSGPNQVAGELAFTRQRDVAMRMLLSYFGGGTTFPLDLLARRYERPPATTTGPEARQHLVVLSDEGLSSFFGYGQTEFDGVAADVRRTLDTGTLMVMDASHSIADSADAAGYDVEYLERMEDTPAACARLAERLAKAEIRG
jgi:hypothetical protein